MGRGPKWGGVQIGQVGNGGGLAARSLRLERAGASASRSLVAVAVARSLKIQLNPTAAGRSITGRSRASSAARRHGLLTHSATSRLAASEEQRLSMLDVEPTHQLAARKSSETFEESEMSREFFENKESPRYAAPALILPLVKNLPYLHNSAHFMHLESKAV